MLRVDITKSAEKQLKECPDHIQTKFDYWVDLIMTMGLYEALKYKGFHDEPLKGKRQGQRSTRLSKSYRVIYRQRTDGNYEVIEVIEVNKHEY